MIVPNRGEKSVNLLTENIVDEGAQVSLEPWGVAILRSSVK